MSENRLTLIERLPLRKKFAMYECSCGKFCIKRCSNINSGRVKNVDIITNHQFIIQITDMVWQGLEYIEFGII